LGPEITPLQLEANLRDLFSLKASKAVLHDPLEILNEECSRSKAQMDEKWNLVNLQEA
jgi:hypothetical protein